jgi:hypothetical protein
MLALAALPERLLFAAAVALLGSPLPAATWAWYRWAKTAEREWRPAVVLLLTSMSYLLLLSGLFTQEVIGPDYSPRRFATIYCNLALMILAIGWSAVYRLPVRRPLIVTTTLLAAAWAYLAVVSSAV